MTNLINLWRVIEDKGIGRLIGILKTNLENYCFYEKRVQIIQSSINPNIYGTFISKDIYYLKNNKLVKNKEQAWQVIYFGENRFKAIDYFEDIVKKDEKMKQNLAHKIFSKN